MKYKKAICIVLVIGSLCGSVFLKAQKSIPIFFEKVYLHTDRSFYAGGDNIWFKAYLVNARTNAASNTSNNLYVELFAPDAKVVKRAIIRLEDGIGIGDFKLPDSIVGGTYHLRAYTNWMKNFGNHFFFEKDIDVVNIVNTSAKAKTKTTDLSTKNGASTTMANHIYFFPEGGTLVANLNALVSFKAINAAGKSIETNGVVYSEKGDTVARFNTTYLGMGSFNFIPMADVDYKAIVYFKDKTAATVDLPAVYAQGYTLGINKKDTNIIANITANQAVLASNAFKEIIVVGRNTGKLLYKEKILLKDGKATVSISQNLFPNGVAAITVYDNQLRPNAERLVYVEHANQLINLVVATDKTVYKSKEKVVLNVTATDAKNQPVTANLSLSVIDEGLLQSSTSNIASYLNLESEIKGDIENAAVYFDYNNNQRLQQLDLLLRTQGWRSFLWRQLADTAYTIKFLPESGIAISGSVKELFGKKLIPNMNITLLAPGAKGDKLYFTKTDTLGKYYLDGLPLYGMQPIKINSKNDKGKKGGIIMMDEATKPSIYYPSIIPMNESIEIKDFAEEAQKRWAMEKKNIGNDATLPGVTVTSTSKPIITRDGTPETNFGYAFSQNIQSEDKQWGTLENYLIHKTSAVADVEAEGVNYQVNGKLVRPSFTVDNREDVFERIDYYAIPIDQIVSVSLNQVIGNVNGNFVDRIRIRLILKPGAYNQDMALLITEIDGYYESRTFYAPTYLLSSEKKKPDLRTTIFWEPQFITDQNGKATISYFNADPKTSIKVCVQGITNNGMPVQANTKYSVK